MSLKAVLITQQAAAGLVAHATSTEREEVMGLLLGDWYPDKPHEKPHTCAFVWDFLPQPRSDRRRDRVEASATQLSLASSVAELSQGVNGRRTRVVGWYHSHPHITPHPSHVDVRTQGQYQALDTGFAGVIVSCFDSTHGGGKSLPKSHSIRMLAFQSSNHAAGWAEVKLPLYLTTVAQFNRWPAFSAESGTSTQEASLHDRGAGSVADGDERSVLSREAVECSSEDCNGVDSASSGDGLGADSRSTSPHAHADTSTAATPRVGGAESGSIVADTDAEPPSPGGGPADRTDAPAPAPLLLVSPGATAARRLNDLQGVLLQEQRGVFLQHIVPADGRGVGVHGLAAMHHQSVYARVLCQLLDASTLPLLQSVKSQVATTRRKVEAVRQETAALLASLPPERRATSERDIVSVPFQELPTKLPREALLCTAEALAACPAAARAAALASAPPKPPAMATATSSSSAGTGAARPLPQGATSPHALQGASNTPSSAAPIGQDTTVPPRDRGDSTAGVVESKARDSDAAAAPRGSSPSMKEPASGSGPVATGRGFGTWDEITDFVRNGGKLLRKKRGWVSSSSSTCHFVIRESSGPVASTPYVLVWTDSKDQQHLMPCVGIEPCANAGRPAQVPQGDVSDGTSGSKPSTPGGSGRGLLGMGWLRLGGKRRQPPPASNSSPAAASPQPSNLSFRFMAPPGEACMEVTAPSEEVYNKWLNWVRPTVFGGSFT